VLDDLYSNSQSKLYILRRQAVLIKQKLVKITLRLSEKGIKAYTR
jgi:hypothetical protein